MKLITAIIAMSLLALSCGPRGYWTRSDFNDAQWRIDSYECQYRAESVCYANAPYDNRAVWAKNLCVNRHFSMCIQARGYHWVEEKKN